MYVVLTLHVFTAVLAALIMLVPLSVYGQQNITPFDVKKGDRNESFTLPYEAVNQDRRNPFVYHFDKNIGENWIMGIQNKLFYTAKEDAKMVLILREAAPSEKFLEIRMYGGESRLYYVAVNTPEIGYFTIHNGNEAMWYTTDAVGITHVENNGFVITDGRRIVVDKLNVNGFNLGSIEVYGNDEAGLPANANAGTISVNLMFGSLVGTPIYYLPGAVMIGVGITIGILLLLKKRKS